jgi:hypothetical protein
MPMYRVLTKCHVNGAVRNEGETFEYNGPDNRHLELLDSPKKVAAPAEEPAKKAEPAKRKWTPKAKKAEQDAD